MGDGRVEELLELGHQRQGGLGRGGVAGVVRDGRPARDGLQPRLGRGVGQHPDDARRALVLALLEVVAVQHVVAVGRRGHRDGPGVRDVGHERAEGEHGGDAGLLGELHQLDGEGAPAERGLDALHQDDVAVDARGRGQQDPGGPPADPAAALVEHDPGAVDLEVVVVLGVERRDGLGIPDVDEVVDDSRRRLAGVVPALEGGNHHGVAQLRDVLELDHPMPPVVRTSVVGPAPLPSLRNAPPGARACLSRLAVNPSSTVKADNSEQPLRPLPQRPRRQGSRGRRCHGNDAPGRRSLPRGLRGLRGVQRDPQRHPARHRPVGPRRLPRGGRRRHRDQHLRRQPGQPRRVRHPRADPRARGGRRAHRPRGRRPLVHRGAGRASSSGRWGRAPSCPRSDMPRMPRCGTRTPSRPGGWSPGAPTRSSSRPRRTCSRPRPRSSAASGPSPRPGTPCRSSCR